MYGEGIDLPVKMEYDMTLAEQAYKLAERWDASRSVSDVSQLDFANGDLDGLDSNQIGTWSSPSIGWAHFRMFYTSCLP